MGFALRLALTDHIDIPREGEPDFLTEADQVFPTPKPQKKNNAKKKVPTPIRPAKAKKTAPKKPLAA